jgi:hypothetical protein
MRGNAAAILKVGGIILVVAVGLVGVAIFLAPRREIVTSIEISASPERVWAILTDTKRYAEWNPEIAALNGQLVPGAVLVIISLRSALAEDSQKITSIIKETQKLTTESGSLVLAWWIPYQYWEESAKANPAINDIMRQDLLKGVQDYTVIGVVDAKKEGLSFSFTPAEQILKTAN